MEERGYSMKFIRACLRNDIDDAARGSPELSLVAGGDDLNLFDRVLRDLRRRAAVDQVLVRQPIKQKVRVPSALSEHRHRCVCPRISLSVDCDTSHELHQVEI